MNKLILATNNKDKIREISEILKDANIEILTASDFDGFPDVEETGTTLEENAILKANAIFERYGLPCIADDTGLEVDYLDGSPGVYSARFAGEGCSYADNNRKMLETLKGVPLEKRTAKFRTVIAFADKSGRIQTVDGTIEGVIASENRGGNGFGYDPVFYVIEAGACLAEMTADEKNAISHRGRAVRNIAPIVIEAFSK